MLPLGIFNFINLGESLKHDYCHAKPSLSWLPKLVGLEVSISLFQSPHQPIRTIFTIDGHHKYQAADLTIFVIVNVRYTFLGLLVIKIYILLFVQVMREFCRRKKLIGASLFLFYFNMTVNYFIQCPLDPCYFFLQEKLLHMVCIHLMFSFCPLTC